MNKKYIILTASYWSWHNAAKNSFKNYLEENNQEVKIVDLVDLMIKNGPLTQNFYILASEKYPLIWSITYKILCTYFMNRLLKRVLVNLYWEKFNNIINEFKPDYIISVYPIWQYLISNYTKTNIKKFNFWVFITDSNISRPWYYGDESIDKFYVIDNKIKNSLSRTKKARKKDIKTTFFPIEEKYFINKKYLKNKNVSILLTWLNPQFSIKLLSVLDKRDFYENIIIIRWRNTELYDELKTKFTNSKFSFLEFVNIKEKLKDIDIFISKPGWAIICECIAQDVFLIAPSYIYWQEQWNIKLIERNKLWFYSKRVSKILHFLESSYKNVDISNFKKIKNRTSIKDLLDDLKYYSK